MLENIEVNEDNITLMVSLPLTKILHEHNMDSGISVATLFSMATLESASSSVATLDSVATLIPLPIAFSLFKRALFMFPSTVSVVECVPYFL